MNNQNSTSWQGVKTWYNKIVGDEGHYFHEHVVIPGVLRLLELKPQSKLLDLGCGQGILARHLPKIASYLGMDISPGLIKEARLKKMPSGYTFQVFDVTKKITVSKPEFTHAAIVLALQNMSDAATVIENAAQYLLPEGKLVIVLNHPCFRIPRQSGWEVDEQTKMQKRWINRYFTAFKIPITMHPGKNPSAVTWSFHHSLHEYSEMLRNAGFVITALEEWASDKESEGKHARMENRARAEFPLFMAIRAEKK